MQHSTTTNRVSCTMWRLACAFIVALLAALVFTQKAEANAIRVSCNIYATNQFDPIGGASHQHQQFGNTSLNNDSTGHSLYEHKDTSCAGDDGAWWTNAGWFPVERYENVPAAIVYYRAPGGHSNLTEIPRGMEIIGKTDPNNKLRELSYSCGSSPGDASPQQATPPYNCTANWSTHVIFPRCWDGIGLEHTDVKYGPNRVNCPSTHPYKFPEINQLIKHPNEGGVVPNPLTVSGDDGTWHPYESMHADYFFAAQDEFYNAVDLNGNGWIRDNAGNSSYNGGYSESSLMDLCILKAPTALDYNNERCRTGGLLAYHVRAINNYYN